MTAPADLEIGLHRRDASSYAVEFRYSHPDSDADIRLVPSEAPRADLDVETLAALELDVAAYGKALGEGLFHAPELRSGFDKARSSASALGAPLRFRLFIGPSAPELHDLKWEALRAPGEDAPLAMSEQVLFSRYLSSYDWSPVRLRPRADLTGLVVVANPANLSEFKPGGRALAPVDVDGELDRARASLGDMPLVTLTTPGQATLNGIVDAAREAPDIIYLVCHGAIVEDEPHLWLEDDDGNVQVESGRELVARMAELRVRPRLFVLASCQSAGHNQDAGALSSLAPRLAEAGVPAVIGMQGNVSMETVATFMPALFRELKREGEIDGAAAAARKAVGERDDWWMPVVFTRLKSGRIWYAPGFGNEKKGLEKWPALSRNVERGRCTPILGPGMTERYFGTTEEISRAWAARYGFPLSPFESALLPKVAQYLAVDQDYQFPRTELGNTLRTELLKRHGGELGDDERKKPLSELLASVGKRGRETVDDEPHRVLAELALPIFLTTNMDNLLADALTDAGKKPRVEICRWSPDLEDLPSIYDDDPDFRPSPDEPLVYHLFGHIREPDSIVLTEDDYFDFLVGVTGNKELIPTAVRRALADAALLFLGFQIDEWPFRVLFRSIMNQEGRGRRRQYAHVAAQVSPDEGRISEPARARRYLEEYFQGADVSIFWGSPSDFARELKKLPSSETPVES